MKLITLVATLALINQAYAFKPVQISKFNINYSNPTGTATAELFSMEDQVFNNPSISVTREDANLRLAFDGDDVIWEDVSDDILLASPFQLVNLNAFANASKAQVSMTRISFKNPKSNLSASQFIMVCDGKTTETEEADKYMESCANNSIMNLGNFTTKSSGKTTEVKDLRLQSKNNKLSFSLELSGIKATGQGRVRYIHNADEKLIEFKVDKVKAGFLTVTKTFFDALDSLPDNIEVRRPYILIRLD